MTEETTPTDPAAAAVAVAVAVAVVLVGVVLVVLASGSSESTDFPRVAPEDMAGRAFQRSQEAYDVLGFEATVAPGVEKIGRTGAGRSRPTVRGRARF
ncbi:hypothetical protein [Streptomyces sp. NPDC001165]|uniref:hypothetical protein n=1 Tax=Streptomyces sp. NPDC001165 TaxID=3364546 RepID=UPI0036AC4E79